MGRTTIGKNLIELIKVGMATKEEILSHLEQHSDSMEPLPEAAPCVEITLSVLRASREQEQTPESKGQRFLGWANETFVADDKEKNEEDEEKVEAQYDPIRSVELYDLSSRGRFHVVRIGRHPSQDLQILERSVSREHGLVVFAGDQMLFCDYGTLKVDPDSEGRYGSTNGTFVNGLVCIRDAMVHWLQEDNLMLGVPYTDTDGDPAYSYRLTYQQTAAKRGAN